MELINNLLAKLDIHTLENLVGETIYKAVQSAYQTNRQPELARLVADRYGTQLLKNTEIRLHLVDCLSARDAELAAQKLGNKKDNSHEFLNRRFSGPFNSQRAIEFVEIFSLPEYFVPPKIEETRLAEENIHGLYGETMISKGVLHPYQRRVKDNIRKALDDGHRRIMCQMPTGAGKTVTALEVITDYLRGPHFNNLVVWVVNSQELADQALESFKSLWKQRGDRPIGVYRYFDIFSSNFTNCSPGVVFASFDKAWASYQSKDAERKSNFKSLCSRSSLVVVDEAHSSLAETYFEIINKLISYNASLIGLSATPGRSNANATDELSAFYGKKLISITDLNDKNINDPIEYLKQEGYLAEIVFEDLSSGTEIKTNDETKVCKELAENPERNSQIIFQIERALKSNESTIVFACTKDHVLALVALCRAKNINVDFVIGEVPTAKRIDIFERFRNNELKIIINHDMLSTGIDLPKVDRLICTRPVGSAILYSQMIGRALRGPKNGGNKKNTVVNINDNLLNFPSAAHVYNSFKNNFI